MLQENEKNIMLDCNRWLNDKHIYATQKLIQQQFPFLGGLQDTINCQTSIGMDTEPLEGIQIHNSRGNHWVTSTSIGGRVTVYDTLSTALNENVQTQLIQCYASLITDDVILNVEISKSQIQKGACDCGLFAIPYALSLIHI